MPADGNVMVGGGGGMFRGDGDGAAPVGDDFEQLFTIVASTPMRNNRRNTRGEVAEIRFRQLEEAQRPDLAMPTLIQRLLDRVIAGHPEGPPALVGLQLHPPAFDRPYVIPLRPPEQNNAEALAAAVERLNDQSGAGIDFLSGTTLTKVLAVWPLAPANPGGGECLGWDNIIRIVLGACDERIEHRPSHRCQSMVRIRNPRDRLCMARAVLIGLRDRHFRQQGGAEGRRAFRAFVAQQRRHGPEARNLLRRAGIPLNRHLYTIDDVRALQRWLNGHYGEGEVRLVVFEKENEYRIIFKGER